MVTIIIGQAGSGKTTYVKRYIKNPVLEEEPIKHTICDDYILIGDYTLNRRELGCDTLSYNSLSKIIDFIEKNKDKNIIIEGDRINNTTFFNFIIKNKIPAEVILLTCSLETSLKRLREENSKITLPFIKMTKTKSFNNYQKYKDYIPFKVVKTDG